jgi:hypothetical protein
MAYWLAWGEPRALEDLAHVEKFFVFLQLGPPKSQVPKCSEIWRKLPDLSKGHFPTFESFEIL